MSRPAGNKNGPSQTAPHITPTSRNLIARAIGAAAQYEIDRTPASKRQRWAAHDALVARIAYLETSLARLRKEKRTPPNKRLIRNLPWVFSLAEDMCGSHRPERIERDKALVREIAQLVYDALKIGAEKKGPK